MMLSIVIPTLQKNLAALYNLLDNLTKDEAVGEIIIIDNGYIIEQLDISDIKYQNISLEKEFLNKTSGSKNQIGGEL